MVELGLKARSIWFQKLLLLLCHRIKNANSCLSWRKPSLSMTSLGQKAWLIFCEILCSSSVIAIDYRSPKFSVWCEHLGGYFPKPELTALLSLWTTSCQSSTLPHPESRAFVSHDFNVLIESGLEWAKLGLKTKRGSRRKIKRLARHRDWAVEREPERKMERDILWWLTS